MDIKEPKVFNIKSEVLYRSAEDDLFYFNKVNSAYKKLKEAVSLTPHHIKSLILLADTAFIKGNIKEALSFYLKAEKLNASNPKIYAGAACCLYIIEKYPQAVSFCNKALAASGFNNYSLLQQVFEIKINCLAAQGDYEAAASSLQEMQNIFDLPPFKNFEIDYSFNYEILQRKINLRKKLRSSGLKIV